MVSGLGVYRVKPAFQRVLRAPERQLVRLGVHPDVITFAALGLSAAGGALLLVAAAAPRWALLAVPLIVFVRTALNALDGMVARSSGRARPWGEVLNEVTDRLADVALLGGLALASYTNGAVGAAVLMTVLFASFVGVLSKALGGPRLYSGVMAKADRMIVVGLAATLAAVLDDLRALEVAQVVLLIGAGVTAAQRLIEIRRELVARPAAGGARAGGSDAGLPR